MGARGRDEGDEDREQGGEGAGDRSHKGDARGRDEGDEGREQGREGAGDRSHKGDARGEGDEGDEGREQGNEGAGVRGHEGHEEGEGRGAGPEEGHEVSSWDGALLLSRSGSLVRAPAPVCGRLHTLVERGRHRPSLWTVEHELLYA